MEASAFYSATNNNLKIWRIVWEISDCKKCGGLNEKNHYWPVKFILQIPDSSIHFVML